ncbi:hypothetical protein [Micromonospora craniellae]|uniref:Uncharacterized protein n=1 Tax=Micromonospora craniellae TaxID=2294034 RepID=A0A372FUZ0_9ACTN|nr:hypothetical protein [Micromonospora craniellae]QOC89726.1 hypothetical protein ID554_15790 [Micromonospora craniellae]RFS44553.1 hypothetical protein D0Q02_21880 [Micromonospora craniellae]
MVRSGRVGSRQSAADGTSAAQVTVMARGGTGDGLLGPLLEIRGSSGPVVAVAVLVGTLIDDLRLAVLVGVLAGLVEWQAERRAESMTRVRAPTTAEARGRRGGSCGRGGRVDVPGPRGPREG